MILTGHQPQYLPYLGFFYKVMCADVLILVDHVQYGKKQFQNRNKIRTDHGSEGWTWLTVPVFTHSRFNQRICEVKINNELDWRKKHLRSIYYAYKNTPFFSKYIPIFEKIYSSQWENLAELDQDLIQTLLQLLNIEVKILKSSDYNIEGEKTAALIDMCKKTGAEGYLSGEGGRNYVDESKFKQAGLSHEFCQFNHPIYQQKFKPFLPCMSVIDLLFNHGSESKEIILKANKEKTKNE